MKRIIISLILLIGLLPFIQSQTVDSIKVEKAGDFIKIRYKILNSTPDQVYRVKVLCSINGGLNTEIRSISGDVGDQVMGGKSDYWVVWDVLKDVDEIKSAEFIVRAELVKDNSLSGKVGPNILPDRKFHVFIVGGMGTGPEFGIKLGYIGSWGITAMYLIETNVVLQGISYTSPVNFGIGNLDLTKRIINTKSFKMHLFIGAFGSSSSIQPDVGLILSINRLAFSIGLSRIGFHNQSNDINNMDLYVGLGMRF